jgi:autotransporter-associated beta strand protein
MMRRPSLRRAVIFSLALAQIAIAIGFVGVRPASAAGWYNSSWSYRKTITIDHTKVTGGPLASFPVLINLSSDADLAAHALSNGNDILFTQSDGTTKINHEVDGYTSSNGALVAWVQVPSVSSAADTVIYLYFGNSGASNQQNATGVWDTNYTGVYHLGNLTTLNANDSTSNARNGTITGATAGTGQMNGAASYTGTNKIATGVALSSFISNTTGTMEAWINASGTAPSVANSYLGQLIVGDPASGGGFVGLVRANVGGSDRIWAYNWDGAEKKVGMTYTAGTWVHMVWVHSGGNLLGYANGALVTSVAAGNTSTVTGTVNIGSNDDTTGTNYFNGLLDEVRLSNVARSAGWIATEYANENSPSTFYSVGALTGNTATWTGAVSNLWSNGGNWSGLGGVAPSAGNDLVFPGSASNLSTSNDIAAGTSFNSITISGSGYTLAGNSITLAGNVSDTSSSGSNTISLAMSMAATRTVNVSNAAETLTISGALSGAGGVTASGSGKLILSGANTFSGATTINAGTVSIAADNGLGTAPGGNTAGQLTFGGGTLATTATFTLATTRGIAFTSTGTIDVASGTTLTYGGVAAGAGGLTKTNSGTLTLSATNTFTGATTINAGTVSIAKDTNLGAVPGSATPGQLTFGGGTLAATANFTMNAKRGVAFNSTATIDVASAATLTIAGIVAGSSGLTETNSGTLVLSGANTYGGTTNISAGTLALGVANAVPSTSAVTATGTFDLAGFADTIGSLAGGGTVTNSGGADATLTTGGDNSSTTFSGVIQDGTKHTILTKAGTGTMTLSGINTYSKGTNINAGTLSISADSGVGSTAAANVLTFGGGTLATTATFTFASTRPMTFTSTATIDVASGTTLTYGGVASSTGGLTKTSAGTLILSGVNTYSGATTINAGTVSIAADSGLGTAPGSATAGKLTFGGGTLATTATFTLNANRGIAFTSNGTIDVASATVLTYGGIAAGTNGLIKTSAGTLLVSGANTYSGATNISAGTLKLGVANSVPSGSAVTVTGTFDLATFADAIGSLAGGGTVTSSAAGAVTLSVGGDNTSTSYSGAIQNGSGTVALTKTGTGTQTLGGTNPYTGTTTVSAGELVVNGAQGSSAVSLNGGTIAGSGTVGAITSTASGGTVDPGVTTGILTTGNINWSTGTPTFSVQLNGTTAGSGYDQLTTSGTINLTGAHLSAAVGFTPTNGASFTIINNTGGSAITGTFSGLAEGASVTLGGWDFKITYLGGTGHSVLLTTGTPVIGLVNSVSPSAMLQSPGTDLAYTITFTNTGAIGASNFVIADPIPNNTDFKLGSATSSLGTTGLSVAVAYSNNGGSTYVYTPVSGAGGAATGYDRTVTNVRWTFTGTLSQTSPNNTGSVGYTAKIQ